MMPNQLHRILVLHNNVGASLVDALVDAPNYANIITPQKPIPITIQNDSIHEVHYNIIRAGTRPAPTKNALSAMKTNLIEYENISSKIP